MQLNTNILIEISVWRGGVTLFRRKYYCCGKVYPKDNLFYCEDCFIKLCKAFETGQSM